MTLTIQIDEELARRLATEARRLGVDSQEFARRLIEEKVGHPERTTRPNRATLDLLAQWDPRGRHRRPRRNRPQGRGAEGAEAGPQRKPRLRPHAFPMTIISRDCGHLSLVTL